MGHLFQKMNEGVPEGDENSDIHSAGIVATRTYKVYNNYVCALFMAEKQRRDERHDGNAALHS